ncbi:MAG: phosphoadenylyl-sulfate reductase [Flavobacteriales bacterium]|nr:phosphoadenylyl-sulfate reductase [Flavobacteriales bacterium]
MTPAEIELHIRNYKKEGKKLFATSSFQTHSIPMLHILSTIDPEIPVLFINTGFHFPETLVFRDQIASLLGIKIIDVHSAVARNLQKDGKGQFYFTSDPDYCCFMNKTQPVEPFLAEYDVWINGIRGDQNANRRNMKIEQDAPFGSKRFHPMLDWSSKMIYDYIRENNLPRHPLENQGYLSIGCEPCTRKVDLNNDRSGRWFGLNKTECGLHTDLISK